jgi:hypothetical protein
MAKAKAADPTILAHQDRLLAVSASKPYPCVLFWKGTKAGVFLPATKKLPIKEKEVKDLARAVGATAVESLKGHCTKAGAGFDFQLLDAGDAKEPDLVKLKSGITDFLNFGKDPKKKDAKNKPVKVGKLTLALVSTLPEIEDDDETTSNEQTARTTSTPPAEAPAAATEPAPAAGNDAASFAVRLKALLPDLKKAQALGGPSSDELKLLTSEAQTLARSKDFDSACEMLDKLKTAITAALGTAASGGGREAQWQQELAAIQPQFAAATQGAATKAVKAMQVIFKFATDQAAQESYDKALAALKKLRPLVANALAAAETGIATGTVEKRRFLVSRWQQIPTELNAEIAKLRTAMTAQVPDEQPEELTGAIQSALDDFCTGMRDALDKAINTGDGQFTDAIALISDLKKQVQSDELIQHLKTNPFDPSAQVEAVLLGALGEVEQALAA